MKEEYSMMELVGGRLLNALRLRGGSCRQLEGFLLSATSGILDDMARATFLVVVSCRGGLG